MHAEDMIPTLLTSNIYVGICNLQALRLTALQLYEMFDGLRIIRINNRVGCPGILNFHLVREVFPYRLATGIPLKQGVPYPL
jgi:hypothetical protein